MPCATWVTTQSCDSRYSRVSEAKLYEKEYLAGGFGHFLSAVAYELRGENDQAYIDYVRMHEKGVGGELVRSALVRLARRLGRTNDLDQRINAMWPQFEIALKAAEVTSAVSMETIRITIDVRRFMGLAYPWSRTPVSPRARASRKSRTRLRETTAR